MPTIKDTLAQLQQLFSLVHSEEVNKAQVRRDQFFDDQVFEDIRRGYDEQIAKHWKRMEDSLLGLDRMPERHWLRHSQKLKDFYPDKGSYGNSVFVMTKYPSDQDKDKPAAQLQAVIDAVVKGIRDRNYQPRLASEHAHHRWLWDNVELYLFACGRGVAIVEDQYLPELNPNVAMEWGWMVGMGREVLFLREESFKHDRADWKGLNECTFKWDDPGTGVSAALDAFLPQRPPAGG